MTVDSQIINNSEARFCTFVQAPEYGAPDMHLVKLIKHHDDGTTTPELLPIFNYKRPFYVTKKSMRKHKDWKEWESLDNLVKFETTQSTLVDSAKKALDANWVKGGLRDVAKTPYLYGADISSSAILLHDIRESPSSYKGVPTKYTVAVADTETDVVRGDGEILMLTVTFGNKSITAVDKRFVAGIFDPVKMIKSVARKLIGETLDKRGLELEVLIVDNPWECVSKAMEKVHEWRPDFLTWWNMEFDIGKMREAADAYGGSMSDAFSDPSVPKSHRKFDFILGQKQKVTASGKVSPIPPAAQWHTVVTPASFYVTDSMRVYKQVRTGQQEKKSYALDALLKEEKIGVSKLKFEEAAHLEDSKLQWHAFMQRKHPIEYIVYNIFDCISVEMFDEKTKDLSIKMPMYSGHSDFGIFNSQPRRKVGSLHWHCLKEGHVMGSTSSAMDTEFDTLTVPLTGLISTLSAHAIVENGLNCIKEDKSIRTRIWGHVSDLDVKASYPNGGIAFNISKETTATEMIRMVGVDEYVRAMQSINLSGGQTNAAEFCQMTMKFPAFDELLRAVVVSKAKDQI